MAVCKNCNSELPEGAMFCMKCGTKVKTELFCPQCGEKVPAGAAFCMKCGAKIGAAEAAGGVSEEKKPEPEPKAAAQGDKIVVSPDGSTGFSKIQAAVDAASDGMMIEIMPGTYTENINIGKPWISDKKNIALVGIADNSGKFPTIIASAKSKPVIAIYGNVNLYRLNIETGATQGPAEAVKAYSDSFVYSELNFDGTISVNSLSDDFGEDCEISNCTITKEIHDNENDCNASCFSVWCNNYETTATFVKVRDCNFEKGELWLRDCDIENCTIGTASVSGEPFLCKNSTIKDSSWLDYYEDNQFVDCKFLDK